MPDSNQIPNLLFFLEALKAKFSDYPWIIAKEPKLGAITTSGAFLLAKERKIKPIEAAKMLRLEIEAFVRQENLPFEVTAVGPYINLIWSGRYLSEFLNQESSRPRLIQQPTKALIDFVGANVAKDLHAGHMRNLNYGETIRRLFGLKYREVVTDNHWGDFGLNMGALLWGWKQVGDEQALEEDLIKELNRVYVWAYAQEESTPDWKDIIRQEFYQIEKQIEPNYSLWQNFVDRSIPAIKPYLEMFNVPELDLNQGESYYQEYVERLVTYLNQNNLGKREGKALFFDFEDLEEGWSDIPRELKGNLATLGRVYILNSAGTSTYTSRDIAARWQWAAEIKADLMLSITDYRQKHNFLQAFTLISYLASLSSFQAINKPETIERLQWQNLKYSGYGFLSLASGKMSTRRGNVLSLRDLYNEVYVQTETNLSANSEALDTTPDPDLTHKITIAALKWYDLDRNYKEDLTLDIPTILNPKGRTGVYMLYTVARINSILKKSATSAISKIKPEKADLEDLRLNDLEKHVLFKLLNFEFILERAVAELAPGTLTAYLYDLAKDFNSWYGQFSVLNESDLIRFAQLLDWLAKIKFIIEAGLDLLAIESVEKI